MCVPPSRMSREERSAVSRAGRSVENTRVALPAVPIEKRYSPAESLPGEKVSVWETARKAIPPGKLLIAGTGAESTSETIALTRQAAEVGADVALAVTPHRSDASDPVVCRLM